VGIKPGNCVLDFGCGPGGYILSDGPTGLPDRSIDVVLLYDVLHHLKRETTLPELRRVLKPGGILSVSDHHMKAGEIISQITGNSLFRLLKQEKVDNFTPVK
jgi:ubiquinone/menaquinone biosynthesis C-methylase UbiE